uniref:hypothetical protein n=1 Tax=Teredinibacter turnerae TaxID=2426 RepID=UPI001E424690
LKLSILKSFWRVSWSPSTNKVLKLTSTAALVFRFDATLPQNKHLRYGNLARRYASRRYEVSN